MNKDLKVLIIESDHAFSEDLEEKLNSLGIKECRFEKDVGSLHNIEIFSPDLAILGTTLDMETCLRSVHKLKIVDLSMPVLTSCEEAFEPGGLADGFEGIHYVKHNLKKDELFRIIEAAVKQKTDWALRPDFPLLIGHTMEMKAIRQNILKVADQNMTVLITGETGTGKELIGRSIHCHSPRHTEPLVKINCGALPDELLESEVFGFQKGAFTGAHQDKPGRLEMANRGTLFIDEIGDLSLSLQAKFLQVLEDKEFSRLGGTRDRDLDIRFVAATNSDLSKKLREGSFRKDLYYRLNVVNIHVPPLRERKEDIPLLADYFLSKYCFEFKRDVPEIPADISNYFLSYHWPGNIRELENVVRRGIVERDWKFIFKEFNVADMKDQSQSFYFPSSPSSLNRWPDEKLNHLFRRQDYSLKSISKIFVSEAERQSIMEALKETSWNRKKAAKMLQVSYKTLLNRIMEYNITP